MFDVLLEAIRGKVSSPSALTPAALIDAMSALHRAESVLMDASWR